MTMSTPSECITIVLQTLTCFSSFYTALYVNYQEDFETRQIHVVGSSPR